MLRAALLVIFGLLGWSGAAAARDVVDASAPGAVSITVYRDPDRDEGEVINRAMPRGFAMISETRMVTLPPGESTIRFEGVAEGMVAVSAIVTGLPGGTIEKNRNADLLSPASLVDGTLGNRVTITRTNPATGQEVAQSAVVRTRADGGLVLQTDQGFEAVRCSGLPERLSFDGLPQGLSARPVFSIDTRDAQGGTYQIVLTYIAWGFDWQAHYVASLDSRGKDAKQTLRLRSWLTLVNDNGQGFDDATLLVVAGRLNVTSDFRALSDPPAARPLRLTCYPLGSTAAGSQDIYPVAPLPAPMALMARSEAIVVTGTRMMEKAMDSAPAMIASEENLGDLKLYRVPEAITVAAKSMKQVAFLDRTGVEGNYQYRIACSPWDSADEPAPMRMVLRTTNDRKHGLGMALPMGGVTLFAPSSAGELLIAEPTLRDYAEGQDVELDLGESPNVHAQCIKDSQQSPDDDGAPWIAMHASFFNANRHPVAVRIELGPPADWTIKGKPKGLALRDGQWSIERMIAPGKVEQLAWTQRSGPEMSE